MLTAKIQEDGREQAIKLPNSYRFKENEVVINKIGDIVLLIPKTSRWDGFLHGLDLFTDDFMADGRNQYSTQLRETI